MGLSETIMAAMIGALATVATALFQLFSSFKQQRSTKVDTRPKKGLTLKSVLAVLALMVASAAGGFLYSEFIKQRANEDMRAMRTELQEMRTLIASSREVVQQQQQQAAAAIANVPQPEPNKSIAAPASTESVDDRVESVVYVPACRGSGPAGACAEQEAQRIALCGTIPSYARVEKIDLYAQPDAMQNPWDKHQVAFEQDLGGARFTGKSFEYAQGADLKAVCVNFMQWSSEHPHIARVVVEFGFGAAPVPSDTGSDVPTPSPLQPMQSPSAQAPTVIAAESVHPVSNTTAFAGPEQP